MVSMMSRRLTTSKSPEDQIFKVVEEIKLILKECVLEDGTMKKFDEEQKTKIKSIGETLTELTFNRKIINSFVEPVKKYYLQFKDLFEQQDRIFKFLEV